MQRQIHWMLVIFIVLSILAFVLSGCGSSGVSATSGGAEHEEVYRVPSFSPVPLSTGEKLQVVATTSIVADVVWNVGGDRIELTTLMPVGTDPHSFEPTPQDVAAVSDAHVVFANGAGLEEFLGPLLESAGAAEKVVYVSQGIKFSELEDEWTGEHDHDNSEAGPHTWTDPNNVVLWVHTIEDALSALDPDNSASYQADAGAYEAALKELDAWIRTQVAQIPETDRKLVTDHSIFDFFADRYGFAQVGTVVPGYSTVAEPSARELAELEDAIRALSVKAVFVGNTVNPSLAQRVAEDTGTQLVFVYTGSLSEKGGPADSYIAYVRFNIEAIVGALR